MVILRRLLSIVLVPLAILVWVFVVLYLLTFGKVWPPSDKGLWPCIGVLFNRYLPKP